MREMTLGSYLPGDSVIHRSDPRTKIILATVFLIAAFIVEGFPGLIFLQLCILFVAFMSGYRIRYFLKSLRPLLWLSLFSAAMSLFFCEGTPAADRGVLSHISLQGAGVAARMFLRLCIFASAASLLTVTTTPLSLTNGLEKLMKPLKRIGLPVHETATMIAIAFRFVPVIMDEARRIIAAQSSRSPDLAGGGLIRRGAGCLPLIIPLLIGSIRRGNDLATAMEARCYRGDADRTRMREPEFSGADLVGASFMIAVITVLTILEQTNL